ncbi:class I SAM-dependent methyltransferase [Maridesulfovibrio salexigens]|uniref:Methyltransferase type 11 n=1 Tax=Maridesulfovibrio salexigens (strain ATCC 14822 / DSM 2638 / NCIMB 8403 / VKM B-1763) TaxID=526222 RepID=C6BYV3_MARSD|nr:class I SAM-dependent methyltransferase [Maridesulfovibrio salexigens]ACS80710.1 Methyltransferase type 11 [Maridesulfovibrio salexigens DSM 2638]
MATKQIRRALTKIIKDRFSGQTGIRHLDIGAGVGGFTKQIKDACNLDTEACDFHSERFEPTDITIKKVNVCKEKLPYEDNSFDLVTSVEVIEHLDSYENLIGEAKRVLKPGGLLILTTPNILNMNSRISYFLNGFQQMFAPIPMKNEEHYSTGSHISPIHYFFLVHALTEKDFKNIDCHSDKIQKSSFGKWLTCLPVLALSKVLFFMKQKKKHLSEDNMKYVNDMFSFRMLTSRTLIVTCEN